jgi:gas vesicle protein
MDKRTSAIQQDIDYTQDSMTEKMEQIEGHVRGSARHVRSSVDDTVDRTVHTVRESVGNNIDQMKDKIDVQQLMNERPWLMLGGSMLAGYTLGNLTESRSSHRSRPEYPYAAAASAHETYAYPPDSTDAEGHPRHDHSEDGSAHAAQSAHPSRTSRAKAASSGFVDDVLDQFGDEIDALQDAAVSTMTRLLRETLQDNLPQLAEEFDRARAERRAHHAQRAHEGAHLDTPQDENRSPSIVEPAAEESRAVPFSHAQKEQQEEDSTSSIVESVRHKM